MSQTTDVFRTMTTEEIRALIADMRDSLRPLYKQVESVAAATLRLRPVFLGKQPFEKRCDMIRKALSLKVNADAVGELLPAFFLERYADDVAELLDKLGLEHEKGVLKGDVPAEPAKAKLKKVVEDFRKGGEKPVMREILLKTFAAQGAVEWPTLDEMVFGPPAPVAAPAPAAPAAPPVAAKATAKAPEKAPVKAPVKAPAKTPAKAPEKAAKKKAAAKPAKKSARKS